MTGLIKPARELVRRRKQNRTYTYQQFPNDLGPHCIVMNFSPYKYNASTGINTVLERSVVLPIPQNLEDTFNAQLGAKSLGPTGAWTSDIVSSKDGVKESAAFAAEKLLDTGKKMYDSFSSGKDMSTKEAQDIRFMLRNTIDNISTSIGTGIDVGTGSTINPYIALAFDGMDLKHHNFSWQLSPRNEDESDKIKQIIHTLKHAMHPSYKRLANSVEGTEIFSDTVLKKAFLEYPSVVDIFFLGIEASYFYYFKRCMISNLVVNYTPEGHVFMKGGKPGIVNITMSLSETEIHTKEDYPAEGAP